MFPVSGVITSKGKPVVGADVTFLNAEKSRSAFGRTDEEGRYQLTTFSQNDGAVDGKSTVTVVKFTEAADTTPHADTDSEDYEPPGFGAPEPASNISKVLPAKYAAAGTSGLFANVMTSGENTFDFELK